jgi:predicted metal-dependent hydrolase
MSKCFSEEANASGGKAAALHPPDQTCRFKRLSKKSAKIASLIDGCRGKNRDPHYLGYFECFNRQWFYEAHDVLEELWLAKRHTPDDGFYKGLIQFAGAFVHLQKERLRPAAALLKLSSRYLQPYPEEYQGLNVSSILATSREWLQRLEEANFSSNPLSKFEPPLLIIRDLQS